jgi:hypothetical protein
MLGGEMSKNVNEELIKKYFLYLFSEYGYRITYSREFPYDNIGVGLESNVNRILFCREGGGWNIHFGFPDAPFELWSSNDWFLVDNIIGLIDNRDIIYPSYRGLPINDTIEKRLSFESVLLQSHIGQIIKLFQPPSDINQLKTSYRQFLLDRHARLSKKKTRT